VLAKSIFFFGKCEIENVVIYIYATSGDVQLRGLKQELVILWDSAGCINLLEMAVSLPRN
jgi:hypothetical protein